MRREALLRERDQLESQRRRSVPPQGADPHPPPSLRGKASRNHLKEEIAPSPACIVTFWIKRSWSISGFHYIRLSRINFIRLSGFPKSELCTVITGIFPAPYLKNWLNWYQCGHHKELKSVLGIRSRIRMCMFLASRIRILLSFSKNSKKQNTFNPPVSWLLNDFLSLIKDVNVASKSDTQKLCKKLILVAILKVTDENSRIRIRLSEIWIRGSRSVPKMSRIPNTG